MLLAAASSGGCGASLNDGAVPGAAAATVSPNAIAASPTAGLGVQSAAAPKLTSAPVPATASLRGTLPAPVSTALAAATPGADGYRIGPQDVLEITVFRVPELSKTVQVAEVGTINMPLLGDVRAAGSTAQDIERDLATKLGAKYLNSPQVSVLIKEYNSQRITVEGSVERPGVYPYRGNITLLQLIASAGGFKDVADTSEIVVFRTQNGRRQVARFNVDDIKSGKSPDAVIMQSDVVVVTPSSSKVLYQDFLKVVPILGVFRPFV